MNHLLPFLPDSFPVGWSPAWLMPWHVALALGVTCLGLFLFARARLAQAKEDWANAFFYSPSQKTRRRQRRQQWQDRSLALLVATACLLLAAGVLFVRQRA